MPGRLTLGLYNSYDPRRFFEAHRRALARAAPLALAFDASVATFGFPFDDLAAHGGRTAENRGKGAQAKRGQAEDDIKLGSPLEIAEYVARSTSVAAEAVPLVELARLGRFQTFDLPARGFPPQLGVVVLTTEHAECPKDTSARAVARELVDGKSQLLVFGLGPRGTPDDVRAMAQWELDITGKNAGLETATAMGAAIGARAAEPRRAPASGAARRSRSWWRCGWAAWRPRPWRRTTCRRPRARSSA